MRLLIDCSNLQVGGGIQVALSFLNDLNKLEKSDEFAIIMSPHFAKTINQTKFRQNFSFLEVPEKSFSNVIIRGKTVKQMEEQVKPDAIFTVFGPSYHFSNYPKVMGFALAHYIYEDSPFFQILSLKERIRLYLYKKLHIFLFRKATKIIFETSDVQERFCATYGYHIRNTFVVANRLNQIFLNPNAWENKLYNFSSAKIILCVTANYRHKNIAIVPQVIEALKDKGFTDFKFVLSLDKNQLNFADKYDQHITYLGKVPLEQLPSLYKTADVLFMPTLLECFSTTYLEAMFMEVPIVTTDLGFARDICQDSALYYRPLDAKDATEKIFRIFNGKDISASLKIAGKSNLERFGTSIERTNAYLEIISKTI